MSIDLYPKYRPEDIGFNNAIVKTFYENEMEKVEAYKKAYDAEQEFDRKVLSYRTGLEDTSIATKKLFAPLLENKKEEESTIDEKFEAEIKGMKNLENDYLLGVSEENLQFGLSLELSKLNYELAKKKNFPAINNKMFFDHIINVNVEDRIIHIFYLDEIASFHEDKAGDEEIDYNNSQSLAEALMPRRTEEEEVPFNETIYDDEGEYDFKQIDYPLTPDLLKLLLKHTLSASEEAKETYNEIVHKCLRNSFTYLKAKLEGLDKDNIKLQNIYKRLRQNTKFVNWFANKYNISLNKSLVEQKVETKDSSSPSSSSSSLSLKSDYDPDGPSMPSTPRDEPGPDESDRDSGPDPYPGGDYPGGPTTRQMDKEFKRIQEGIKRGHVEERKKKKEPPKTDSDIEIEKEIEDEVAAMPSGISSGKRDGKGVIVISPHSDEQLKRLMILLGSKKSGNSANMLAELTALLDALMKDNKIDTKLYKKFLKKFNKP